MLPLTDVDLKQQVAAIRCAIDRCNQVVHRYTRAMPLIRAAVDAAGAKALRAQHRQVAASQRYADLLKRMDRLAARLRDGEELPVADPPD